MKKIVSFFVLAVLIVSGCGNGSLSEQGAESEKIIVTPGNVCIEKGTQQQFKSSVEGVTWSLEPLIGTQSVGTITQDGLFNATSGPVLGRVIASKSGVHGFAYVTVVQSKLLCSAKKIVFKDKKVEEEDSEEDGVEGDATSASDSASENESSGTVPFGQKWFASFNAALKYEVKGDEVFGYVTHEMDGGFYFTVDHASGKVEISEPAGFVNVAVSDDVGACETVTVNDPFLWINATDAKLVDTNLVFGKKFLTVDHAEGVKMSCVKMSFSEPDASVVDLIGKYAFPIEVDFQDGESMPIHGSFSFSGRSATIDGTVKLKKFDPQAE